MTSLRPMPLVVYAHMASKCDELIGRTRAAGIIGVDVEDMRRICRGDVAPSSRQRDAIDRLFAMLLSHELEWDETKAAGEGEDKQGEEAGR